MTAAISTRALRKVYRKQASARGRNGPPPPGQIAGNSPPSATGNDVVALDALDLEVRAGEFFGLLGPNGAGKSTTIGILTTRIRPTSGHALVAGEDVGTCAPAVRQRIGVVPQRPNPDRSLDVRENLIFHAAYFGVARAEAAVRADRALVHVPDVIFLDEPTVGLDPQARLGLWEILRKLHDAGRTIVMTTHYMEEADQLCDRLAIIDRGRLLALDTPMAPKARAPGGTLVLLTLGIPHTPIVASASALLVLSAVFWVLGIRGFELRAIG